MSNHPSREEVAKQAEESAREYVESQSNNPNFQDPEVVEAFVEIEVEIALEQHDEQHKEP